MTDLSAADQTADDVRDQLLHAIDFNYAAGLGYGTPEGLLAAYDASRTPPPADQTAPAPCTAYIENAHSYGRQHCIRPAEHTDNIAWTRTDHASPSIADAGCAGQAGRIYWNDTHVGAVPHQPAAPPTDQTALRKLLITALDNAHHTHPCPALGDQTWSGCVHYDDAGRMLGVGVCHSERRADAVLAVLPPPADRATEVEQLRIKNERMRHELEVMYSGAFDSTEPADRAELDSLGREADRLRKAWGEMRDRAERIEAEVKRMRADRAAVLREAADRIDREDLPQDDVDMFDNGARWATKLLRRMADETATTGPQPESCTHCGKTILRITGTLTAWWVHDPGGNTVCHPQQAASSPRATPKRPPMDPVHILGIDAEDDEPAAEAQQDAPDHVCNSVQARGEMDELLGYLICGVCGTRKGEVQR